MYKMGGILLCAGKEEKNLLIVRVACVLGDCVCVCGVFSWLLVYVTEGCMCGVGKQVMKERQRESIAITTTAAAAAVVGYHGRA